MTKTWTNENKELIISLFDLKEFNIKTNKLMVNEKKLEEVVSKLNEVDSIWSEENVNMLDIVSVWNNFSNNNAVTMMTLLDGFAQSSQTAITDGLTIVQLSELITKISVATYEGGNSIGNALKSIIGRIKNEEVADKLKSENVHINSESNIVDVLNDAKKLIDNTQGYYSKAIKTIRLVELLGGKYHTVRTAMLLG